VTISRHQVDRAFGNIRLLGPDLPDFDRDVKLVSDYVDQISHERDELLEGLDHIGSPNYAARPTGRDALDMAAQARLYAAKVRDVNQPDTVVRSSGAKEGTHGV